MSTTIEPEAVESYTDYYHEMDFIAAACVRSPVGLVQTGTDLVANNKRTEFHNDWQRRFEMTDGLFARLDALAPTSFIVSAPPRSLPFANTERLEFAQALVPHIQRSLSMRHHLLDSDLRPVDVSAAFDVIRHGVIILDAEGQIFRMNSSAQRTLLSHDGLRTRGCAVEATVWSANEELHAAITNAFRSPRTSARLGSYVVCGRSSTRRPLLLRVIPLDTADDPCGPASAIVIIDPDQEVRPPEEVLRSLFGLTQAEREVALCMLRGDGLKAIADELTLTLATVKTHVQRIFLKTNTHRQAELVRLLLTISP